MTTPMRSPRIQQGKRALRCAVVCSALALALAGCARNEAPAHTNDNQARSFTEHQIRYMTPLDLMSTLKRLYPAQMNLIDLDCKELTNANRALTGDTSALTGSPVFQDPSSGFVRWYSGCLRVYINGLIEAPQSYPWVDDAIYGSTFAHMIKADGSIKSKLFSSLDPSVQRTIVLEQITRMIGPNEVVADFGYFANSDEMADWVLTNLPEGPFDVLTQVKEIHFLIGIRDEFLSY